MQHILIATSLVVVQSLLNGHAAPHILCIKHLHTKNTTCTYKKVTADGHRSELGLQLDQIYTGCWMQHILAATSLVVVGGVIENSLILGCFCPYINPAAYVHTL